jgi:hypothetical protein
MKKLLYLILTAVFAITLSSYTVQPSERRVANGDSVLIKTNVSINVPRYQKGDDALITKATEVMQELVSQGDSRLLLMQDALNSSSTKIEEVCIFLNITSDELFKKARADTLIKFITSLLIGLLLISGVYYLFSYAKNSMNWQGTMVITIVFTISVILLQNHLYDILSYCFNRDYQNILNFTKLIN